MTRRWEIWAPSARSVELLLEDGRVAAEPLGDGRWTAPAPAPGVDYAISIDRGPPRPDPRSRCQPYGVHGASRWAEVHHAWTDQDFTPPPLGTGTIYELHVGTFTPRGTFVGAIDRLDHLVRLGVTHVELMPVAHFPGVRGWGYDGVDLFAPHASYGGLDGLCTLVDACHRRGLAVILDVVYNHLGPDGNYLAELGPFFTDRHHTPWGPAVNYDGDGAAGVRRFVVDNALFWLRDCHIDGLRLDATDTIHDDSDHHILAQLADEVRALEAELGRPKTLIAENDENDPALVAPRRGGGHGLDAHWYNDLHRAIHAALTGERLGDYAPWGTLADVATALTGHGEAGARVGHSLGPADGHRMVAYLQNHDQVGNRAGGERLGHLVSPGRLRLAAALLFTSPFVPLIFQGEEWNASTPFLYFTDHQDLALAEAVREGRRREHPAIGAGADRMPDPQDPITERRSLVPWSEIDREPHRSVLAWYTALAGLRRSVGELLDGKRERIEVTVDDDAGVLELRRGRVTLLGNLGDRELRRRIPPGDLMLAFPDAPRVDRGEAVVPPDGCAIWVRH